MLKYPDVFVLQYLELLLDHHRSEYYNRTHFHPSL